MPDGEAVVHIPQNVEILAPSELTKFSEDLATMEKYYRDLDPIFAEAKQLQAATVKDDAWRTRCGELVSNYKEIAKNAETLIKRYKDIINKFKEEYCSKPEKRVVNRAEEIKGILTPLMADWDREDARVREQERLAIQQRELDEGNRQAELKRQADEKVARELRERRVNEIRQDLKDGKFGDLKTLKAKRHAQKLLEEAGAVEEARLARAQADEMEAKVETTKRVESVKVTSSVAPIAGNVKRVNYAARCVDKDNFVVQLTNALRKKDFVTYNRLLEVVVISDEALSEKARQKIKTSPEDTKHELTVKEFEQLYPFVTVEEKRTY